MAADSSKILRNTGIAGICAGASGVLLHLSRRRFGEEVVLDARAHAELALFFFTFLAGEAMAVYSLLLAKGLVPAVSPGLAKKLSCIPLVAFLVLAVHVPLGGTGSTVLYVEMVGNGRVAGPREGEAGRGIVEDGLDPGDAGNDGRDGVDVNAE